MVGEIILKFLYLDKTIDYDGQQLRSHWIFDQTGIYDDMIIGFSGKADVNLDHMVDLEDVMNKAPIYSEKMLHFIVEHFDENLDLAIGRQRLLISIIKDIIEEEVQEIKLVRKGDDLYFDHKKLSVSIATRSQISTLIHVGLNISTNKTPVPTYGLDDLGLKDSILAKKIMERYVQEINSMRLARVKVKSVL